MTANAGQVLRSLEPFSGWPTEVLGGLLQRARRVRLQPGDVLFREGEPGNSLFLVLEGHLKVTLAAGERAVRLAELGPGAILGEMVLIDPSPRSATATATAPSTCLGLSAQDLEELQWEDPPLASALLRAFTHTLAGRVRTAEVKLAAMQDPTLLRTLWMGAT